TFVNKHTCGKELKSNLADCNWVASKLVKVIVTRPDLTPKEAKQHMNEVYKI
ncbi:hypothetical protein PIB30_114973, partial [Stylosanthes scabra]|nr:hypothetical protein [Stylosanthes scabra]